MREVIIRNNVAVEVRYWRNGTERISIKIMSNNLPELPSILRRAYYDSTTTWGTLIEEHPNIYDFRVEGKENNEIYIAGRNLSRFYRNIVKYLRRL
ncbi:hypothetical protein [Pyrococcus kukulkanii]|uniref:Uncharacterized protein n=1 Tax=Pyrococcus kukulkanii TaxID=1609559 RepID=A0ABV4T6C2_9EURY